MNKMVILMASMTGPMLASTIMQLPVNPPVGSVRQLIDPTKDLAGTRWTATFSNGHSVSCYWQDMGACGYAFSVSNLGQGKAGLWNKFQIHNSSGSLMTGLQIDALTATGLHDFKIHGGHIGMLAIDTPTPNDPLGGTRGSGGGHQVLGNFLSFQLLRPLSGDLYGGLKFKTQIYNNRDLTFRADFDKMVPTPEPATLLLTGAGLAALGWWKRRKATGPSAN